MYVSESGDLVSVQCFDKDWIAFYHFITALTNVLNKKDFLDKYKYKVDYAFKDDDGFIWATWYNSKNQPCTNRHGWFKFFKDEIWFLNEKGLVERSYELFKV
jgi:hypothetical protein